MDPVLFLLLGLVVLVGGAISLRRRKDGGWDERLEREPWTASLREADDDDEPLDEDAIREAEDAFLAEDWDRPDAEDPW
jgi:LPXTG-motif cell wall-anchored protein